MDRRGPRGQWTHRPVAAEAGEVVDRPPLDDGEESGKGGGTNVLSTLSRTDGSRKRTP